MRLYHAQHYVIPSVLVETPAAAIRTIDEIGTWFSATAAGAARYGKNVVEYEVDDEILRRRWDVDWSDSDDPGVLEPWERMWTHFPDLLKAAATKMSTKARANLMFYLGLSKSQRQHLAQFNANNEPEWPDSQPYLKAREGRGYVYDLLRDPTYVKAVKARLISLGYTAVVMHNTDLDGGPGLPRHDVAIVLKHPPLYPMSPRKTGTILTPAQIRAGMIIADPRSGGWEKVVRVEVLPGTARHTHRIWFEDDDVRPYPFIAREVAIQLG